MAQETGVRAEGIEAHAGRPGGTVVLRRLAGAVAAAGAALPGLGWGLVSVSLFACLWELLWAVKLADPRLLPPPHIFYAYLAATVLCYMMLTTILKKIFIMRYGELL